MNLLTESELLALLNTAPGVSITRSLFRQSLRPLMVKTGMAQQLGTGRRATWAYDGSELWQWREYLAVRVELIRRGECNSKTPYSLSDMEYIVIEGAHGEVVDALFPSTAYADPAAGSGKTLPATELLRRLEESAADGGGGTYYTPPHLSNPPFVGDEPPA